MLILRSIAISSHRMFTSVCLTAWVNENFQAKTSDLLQQYSQYTSVPIDLSMANWQRFWFGGPVRKSSMPATYATSTRHTSHSWLKRKICRPTGELAGPEHSAPLSLSWEQATVRFWPATFTASDNNSLQRARTVEATTRRLSIFFFAVRHTHRHIPLPTTSTRPILDACGPFWSRSGPWHAPSLTGNERERESIF